MDSTAAKSFQFPSLSKSPVKELVETYTGDDTILERVVSRVWADKWLEE